MPLYCGKKNAGFKPVGNLTENNGVYSGFYAGLDLASSGYLQAAQALPNKISSFYFYTKFTWIGVGSSILSSVQDLKGLADIAIADDGTYRVWISSNGTSYDIAESFKGKLDRPNIDYGVVEKEGDGTKQLMKILRPYIKNGKVIITFINTGIG